MSTIDSIVGKQAGSALPTASAHTAACASAELAKLENQLSVWVNCPSGKTAAGQARIAEINRQIDAVKAQVQKAAEARAAAAVSATVPNSALSGGSKFRLDGLGANLDVQA